MVERQTQVATSGKWRPQRSGEESATGPWIARVEAHCTCTLHSWDLKYLKKHIRPQPWHLWQFGEGEQYHFLTGCLEVHWMYAIVFHWKICWFVLRLMAEQAASSTGQSASSTASSSKCAPVCLNSTLLHESVHLLKFLETLLGLPVNLWSLHEIYTGQSWLMCSLILLLFLQYLRKKDETLKPKQKKWMQCVQWSKKREKKREGTSSSWSYNSYSWPISLPHCHSFICTRSFESEPYRGEVTKINLEYRTMDGQWFLASGNMKFVLQEHEIYERFFKHRVCSSVEHVFVSWSEAEASALGPYLNDNNI